MFDEEQDVEMVSVEGVVALEELEELVEDVGVEEVALEVLVGTLEELEEEVPLEELLSTKNATATTITTATASAPTAEVMPRS